MCRGHPTGICDSSRSPSPFCSIISPSIGEVLRLTRGRLHCHVSGEVILVWPVLSPLGKRLVTDDQCFLFDHEPELGGDPLVAVVSWNQVGRIDLTSVTLPESVLLTLSGVDCGT